MYQLLFADDDPKLRRAVKEYLSANGFEVTLAKDGEEATDLARLRVFDLIILDVMMPNTDGVAACGRIRKICNTPVLFLSALGEERDLLKGYGAGADDYIVKPFPLSVLCEKCLAVIRRNTGASGRDVITAGQISLDARRGRAFAGNRKIPLSAKDFAILQYLMSRKGIVLSRSLILSRVWGYDFEGDDRVVDTHIKNIRKALGEYGTYIQTVSGMGYRFEEAL
ncbi:MAG: response regulator transcription factor [Clostridia bacterium]|nr:response regulator transcription factor [Clostridia bacterium]